MIASNSTTPSSVSSPSRDASGVHHHGGSQEPPQSTTKREYSEYEILSELAALKSHRTQLSAELNSLTIANEQLTQKNQTMTDEMNRIIVSTRRDAELAIKLQNEMADIRKMYNEKVNENIELSDKIHELMEKITISNQHHELRAENDMLWRKLDAIEKESPSPSGSLSPQSVILPDSLLHKVQRLPGIGQMFEDKHQLSSTTLVHAIETLVDMSRQKDDLLDSTKRNLMTELSSTKFELSSIQEKLNMTSDKLASTQDKLARAQAQQSTPSEELTSMKHQILHLESLARGKDEFIDSLKVECEMKDRLITSLKADKESMVTESQERHESQMRDLKLATQLKEKELHEAHEQAKEFSHRIEELTRRIEEQASRLKQQEETLAEQEQRLKDQKEQCVKVESNDEVVEELNLTISEQKKAISEQEEIIKRHSETMKELSESLKDQSETIREQRETIEEQKQHLNDKGKSIAELEATVSELEATLANQKETISAQEGVIGKHEAVVEEKEEQQKKALKEKENQIEELTRRLEESQTDSSTSHELTELQSVVDKLQSKVEKSEKAVGDKQHTIDQLKTDIRKLKAEASEKNKELQEAYASLSGFSKIGDELGEDIESCSLGELKGRFLKLSKEHSSLKSQCENEHDKLIATLRDKLAAAKEQSTADLRDKHADLIRERDNLEKEFKFANECIKHGEAARKLLEKLRADEQLKAEKIQKNLHEEIRLLNLRLKALSTGEGGSSSPTSRKRVQSPQKLQSLENTTAEEDDEHHQNTTIKRTSPPLRKVLIKKQPPTTPDTLAALLANVTYIGIICGTMAVGIVMAYSIGILSS